MKETVFNLFLFISNNIINEIGVVSHQLNGTDKEKLFFLQSQVDNDLKNAKKIPIPSKFSRSDAGSHPVLFHHERYNAMMRLGRHLQLFEEIFQNLNAPDKPLLVITSIVDGKIIIDAMTELDSLRLSLFQNSRITGSGIMIDYLEYYTTARGFDISNLINDDYFLSIKLLYNNRHYVSAAKLLFSFIDTIAYLEFGDISKNFQKWLDCYADLSRVGVNSSELWEMRNSLLHMTNPDSRQVLSGRVRRLVFYVGNLPESTPIEDETAKYFSLNDLIDAIISALQRWFLSFNENPSKMEDFIIRYDRILSDTRYAVFSHD
jgi:hypothetical protein